jgi:hypothetical protein
MEHKIARMVEGIVMRYLRPGALTAAAILCIVIGSLFLLSEMLNLINLLLQGLFPGDEIDELLMEAIERDVPAYRAVVIGSVVVGFIEALLLLISGIGLLSLSRPARTAAILGCVLTIVVAILGAIFSLVSIVPATRNAFAAMPAVAALRNIPVPGDLDDREFFIILVQIVAVVFSLLMIIPMIIVLVLLTRPPVVSAFKNPLPADLENRLLDLEDDLRDDRYR